ncbi:hypothetical protein J437_LFUL006982 [Ladona fulva]|uniref:DNA repair protein REV1 n=1 Tax=Ladona fulva TaxID=123851 RepID=A0A8K0K3J3_LADFU|nr:hypothetical protein J437_LFUL006982 [Ladona fulva]
MARKISHKDERHDYFAAKKAKLSEQFLECRGEPSEKPPQIFIGVRVYINGYTVPPAEELKNIIVKHGGIYSVFLDSAVTHMVANNLPDSKLKVLKKVKVVKPEWILDSAKQGKLLNCSEYLTYNSGKDKNIWNKIREENSTPNSPNKVSSSLSLAEKEDNSAKPTENIPEEGSSSGKNGPVAGADVHSFYSRSRLHFLSTIKMELRRIEDSIGELSHRVVIHIDMDCFFVSVSRVGRPELEGRPVVVTSSKIANFGGPFHEIKDSMADIASCSYEARAAGVRNGMRVGRALQICPKLVAVPYEFEKYRNVSYKFYEIVASYTIDLEAVSCDELYIDCTSVLLEANCTPLEFAEHIRKEIKLYSYGLPKLEKEFGPATGKTLYMHCQGLDSHSKEDSGSVERKSRRVL